VGYPLQYNQYPWRKQVWTVQFTLQLLLSKVLPFLITPPIFMRIQDGSKSYSRILKDAERTTKVLQGLGAAVVAALAWVAARGLLLPA
jgi:hypothetical protein